MTYDRTEHNISYMKNGTDLGVAFDNVYEKLLYPAVGLRTPGEQVCIISVCVAVHMSMPEAVIGHAACRSTLSCSMPK